MRVRNNEPHPINTRHKCEMLKARQFRAMNNVDNGNCIAYFKTRQKWWNLDEKHSGFVFLRP